MKIFLLIIILLSPPLITYGQKESKFYSPPDSLRNSVKENIILPFEISPGLIIPLSYMNSYPLSLKMGTYSFAHFPENDNELNTELLYPSMNFRDKYKMSFLYTILGAAQLGAVGYMAYKHVKKYGLFK